MLTIWNHSAKARKLVLIIFFWPFSILISITSISEFVLIQMQNIPISHPFPHSLTHWLAIRKHSFIRFWLLGSVMPFNLSPPSIPDKWLGILLQCYIWVNRLFTPSMTGQKFIMTDLKYFGGSFFSLRIISLCIWI